MKAGAAKIDITPKTNVWMDGMIREHPSTGVHDPLYARALILAGDEDPTNIFALVSVDVCCLHDDHISKVREKVLGKVGIPIEHIVIATTHTHSGPATIGYFNPPETEYVLELLNKIAQVIEQATGDLRPAAVGCGSGEEHTISHYRRLLADDGHVVMNWEPYPQEKLKGPLGVIDPEVGVIKVVEAQNRDRVIAVLFNHAGHPNVMSGDSYVLSADYPGVATRLVEEALGGQAIFINGAQGTMDIDGLKDRDWEGVDRVGGALAKAVVETFHKIDVLETVSLRGAITQYAIPSRKISDEELAWADKILEETGGKIQFMADGVGDDYKATLYKKLRDKQTQDITMEQVCVTLDDTALISFPCELFTEIGMKIKSQSPLSHTYLMGLTNGNIGYVPAREAVSQGGYEVDTRAVDASAEDLIIEHSLALLEKIRHE